MAFAATWMNLEIICYYKSDSEIPTLYAITCGTFLQKDTMNFFAEQVLAHKLKNLWFPIQ